MRVYVVHINQLIHRFMVCQSVRCSGAAGDTYGVKGFICFFHFTETKVTPWYSLHHAATVRRQSVVRVVDVRDVFGAPQSLCHSAGSRPSRADKTQAGQWLIMWPWPPLRTSIQKPYQSRGVRLVASTYSPHRQASPPITSFFCSSVPCGKSQTLWDIMLFRSIQRLCDKMAAFIVLPLYSTGLHRLTRGGGQIKDLNENNWSIMWTKCWCRNGSKFWRFFVQLVKKTKTCR